MTGLQDVEWEECPLEPRRDPELEREIRKAVGMVIPFARETIWYRPAEIQRRARTLLDKLDAAQFVELIGTVSLANAVSRLAIVLDEC